MQDNAYLIKGTKEFLNDVMGLPISTGGINIIKQRIAQKLYICMKK